MLNLNGVEKKKLKTLLSSNNRFSNSLSLEQGQILIVEEEIVRFNDELNEWLIEWIILSNDYCLI